MAFRLLSVAGLALAMALISGAAMAAGEDAADPNVPVLGAAKPQTPPGWNAGCQSANRTTPMACQMEQRAVLSGSGQLIGSVAIRIPSDTRKPVILVRGPLGLSLPAGVVLQIDGHDFLKLPFQTCDGGGCYASTPLSGEQISILSKGAKLDVTFQNLSNGAIKLPMSLESFSATYAQIK